MRAAVAALAVFGYGVLAAAFTVSSVRGDGGEVSWLLIGVVPFCAIGLLAFVRRPDNRVVWWLVGFSAAYAANTAIGDVFLPMAERHWGTDASVTALVALVCQWAGVATSVGIIGMLGLVPTGRPLPGYERFVIAMAAGVALFVPLFDAASGANIALTGWPDPGAPVVHSPVTLAALTPLRWAFVAVFDSYPFWSITGVVLLAVRYRRSQPGQRHQIRWLLVGMTATFGLWVPLYVFWYDADPAGASTSALASALSALALCAALAGMLTALFHTGVFGIDEPRRRAIVRQVLRSTVAVAIIAAAITAGLLIGLVAPAALAVVVGVSAAVAGQAVRGHLEHAADRWMLGSRLAGYANLNRFGRSLTHVPDSAGLLGDLAGEVRRGLDLTWARVSLVTAAGSAGSAGSAGPAGPAGPEQQASDGAVRGQPAATVVIAHRGEVLGRIDCGPRADGALLPEDRRLLAYFAAQAAVGVHNLRLTEELSKRVNEIRAQAVELAASRERVMAGQDAERRRIQRVLHDGIQQEIVALSARAGLVDQQLRRGDPAAARGLAEMQRELATTLRDVRDIAYSMHPPVLSDRGLLEAIEAQSSRLALPMAVRADPRLRGVRFGEQVEGTAWYVLSEALANVVKHADAREVEVALHRENGSLGLVVRDDGCGFDPAGPRGLGLAGLSDRVDTVGGMLSIDSAAGRGTTVSVRIPVDESVADA